VLPAVLEVLDLEDARSKAFAAELLLLHGAPA